MMNRTDDDPRDRQASKEEGSGRGGGPAPSIHSSAPDASEQKVVAFLGDSDTPRPLGFSTLAEEAKEAKGSTTCPTSLEEAKEAEGKKPAATVLSSKPSVSAVSSSSSGVSSSDEDFVLMGQTFNSLLEKDIPEFVRQHAMALTFPQKLMLMLMHVEHTYATSGKKAADAPIAWLENGLGFVIRDQGALVNQWLPLFFRQSKFPSFTRKLYRWQFRQIFTTDQPFARNSNSPSLIFGHDSFQRDRKALMANMRSVTAEAKRREELSSSNAAQQQQVVTGPSWPHSPTSGGPPSSPGWHRNSLDTAATAALPTPVFIPNHTPSVLSPLGGLAASLDTLTLLRSLHQAPPNSDAQNTLLQLLVAHQQQQRQQQQQQQPQQQSSSQQVVHANNNVDATRQLLVALLTSQLSAPAAAPPPPPPLPEPRRSSDEQENLRQLVSLLLRQSESSSASGYPNPIFPPFQGPPAT